MCREGRDRGLISVLSSLGRYLYMTTFLENRSPCTAFAQRLQGSFLSRWKPGGWRGRGRGGRAEERAGPHVSSLLQAQPSPPTAEDSDSDLPSPCGDRAGVRKEQETLHHAAEKMIRDIALLLLDANEDTCDEFSSTRSQGSSPALPS